MTIQRPLLVMLFSILSVVPCMNLGAREHFGETFAAVALGSTLGSTVGTALGNAISSPAPTVVVEETTYVPQRKVIRRVKRGRIERCRNRLNELYSRKEAIELRISDLKRELGAIEEDIIGQEQELHRLEERRATCTPAPKTVEFAEVTVR